MAEAIQRQADELARYVAELSRRIATPEVHDLNDLMGLSARLREALALVTPQEISWAVERATALLQQLESVGEQLAALDRLKRAFETMPDLPL